MYRYLVLASCVLSNMTLADDSWVSLPATPTTAPVVAAGSVATDVSQVRGAPASSSDLAAELLLQLEQMQQELSLLRNLVEQNTQNIDASIATDQQRYLDVDRRLSTLTQELLLRQSDDNSKETAVTDTPAEATPDVAAQISADDAYQKAMALLRDKDFESAKSSFEQFRKDYKAHPLVANALYWQAEVLLIDQQLNDAAQLFEQVVTQFPQHGKAPDAAYKLGVTLHRQGNLDAARQQLQQVIDQYSDTSESTVKLAEGYLQRL